MQASEIDRRLGEAILHYVGKIDKLDTPAAVLDNLHEVTHDLCDIDVLGALLFPVRCGDWESLELGKTVFIHKSAPKGWWKEYFELLQKHPAPGFIMAQLALAPFTGTDTMRMVEPLGVDRWPFDLALKHGMRDVLSCPVGGRWVVSYWSRKAFGRELSNEWRAMLFMGATFAAIRLQALVEPSIKRLGKGTSLTPREIAVLRLLSLGKQVKDIAKLLALGEETVRSHLKKAQSKLGVNNRTHAVARALRLHMIN